MLAVMAATLIGAGNAMAVTTYGTDKTPMVLQNVSLEDIVANKNGLARLDNNYTVYGQVIKGMDVVETIVSVPTDSLDAPLVPIPLTVTVVEMTAAELQALGYTPEQ